MFRPYTQNDVLLAMMETLTRESDWEPVREAFESAKGDFTAKFTAAVEARFAQLVQPETFIDVPEHPEKLRKADLDALVRPVADGFLRSYPSKDELVDQAYRIRRRQDRRPPWIPRLDRDGKPMPTPRDDEPSDSVLPERPLTITALPELGDVPVLLPAGDWDRPELAMKPGGVGEWEAALHAVLGVTHEHGPATTVLLDADSNEALVPDDRRWWQKEPTQPLSAAQDPGVASELLATSPSLGGLSVVDDKDQSYGAVVTALCSAGDWRYSPRWSLELWGPGDGMPTLATARAAIAGWADEGRSGLIVYIHGGALHAAEGLVGVPSPLHSYLLCVTRTADGTDTVDTVHRVHLSCPGDNWCHRGGCPDVGFLEAAPLLEPVIAAGDTAAVADASEGWAEKAYKRLYGANETDDYTEGVLDYVQVILSSSGWVELNRSTWEGGLEDLLLRRDEQCLLVSYDSVTRQVRFAEGRHELDLTLQLLADDGVLIGDEGQEAIDMNEDAREQWGTDLLNAADDFLHGRIDVLQELAVPVQGSLLGLHPHADGSLRAPESTPLVEKQCTELLNRVGLLEGGD
ncbi:hypothetical protein [Actinomadura sp. WAC 06369]|uniref:hypothetical protein n=1 Tax=Actinomadura sp. WAC 06369 TaxID=2203193 RepID=UPI000F783B7D|nr:hypothetical protein [Actinomadura sp. WAC 06369]